MTYYALCKMCKLDSKDLENMTIGMALDYIDEYLEMKNPNKKKVRKASQEDFDKF